MIYSEHEAKHLRLIDPRSLVVVERCGLHCVSAAPLCIFLSFCLKLSGAAGVISCVGAFGSDEQMEKICGDATVVATEASEKVPAVGRAVLNARRRGYGGVVLCLLLMRVDHNLSWGTGVLAKCLFHKNVVKILFDFACISDRTRSCPCCYFLDGVPNSRCMCPLIPRLLPMYTKTTYIPLMKASPFSHCVASQ